MSWMAGLLSCPALQVGDPTQDNHPSCAYSRLDFDGQTEHSVFFSSECVNGWKQKHSSSYPKHVWSMFPSSWSYPLYNTHSNSSHCLPGFKSAMNQILTKVMQLVPLPSSEEVLLAVTTMTQPQQCQQLDQTQSKGNAGRWENSFAHQYTCIFVRCYCHWL